MIGPALISDAFALYQLPDGVVVAAESRDGRGRRRFTVFQKRGTMWYGEVRPNGIATQGLIGMYGPVAVLVSDPEAVLAMFHENKVPGTTEGE